MTRDGCAATAGSSGVSRSGSAIVRNGRRSLRRRLAPRLGQRNIRGLSHRSRHAGHREHAAMDVDERRALGARGRDAGSRTTVPFSLRLHALHLGARASPTSPLPVDVRRVDAITRARRRIAHAPAASCRCPAPRACTGPAAGIGSSAMRERESCASETRPGVACRARASRTRSAPPLVDGESEAGVSAPASREIGRLHARDRGGRLREQLVIAPARRRGRFACGRRCQ